MSTVCRSYGSGGECSTFGVNTKSLLLLALGLDGIMVRWEFEMVALLLVLLLLLDTGIITFGVPPLLTGDGPSDEHDITSAVGGDGLGAFKVDWIIYKK